LVQSGSRANVYVRLASGVSIICGFGPTVIYIIHIEFSGLLV
jgi:hypothetical protein